MSKSRRYSMPSYVELATEEDGRLRFRVQVTDARGMIVLSEAGDAAYSRKDATMSAAETAMAAIQANAVFSL